MVHRLPAGLATALNWNQPLLTTSESLSMRDVCGRTVNLAVLLATPRALLTTRE